MVLDIRQLIKECVTQVLKEGLEAPLPEAFDPTSVGTNPAASEGLSDGNPYAAWNEKMRQMEGTGKIELVSYGTDDWGRPLYRDNSGRLYADINLGKGTPSIHSLTDEGEPLTPVHNVVIKGNHAKNDHPNALCPRCKNSKPELMAVTSGGKAICKLCRWEENPGEPKPVKEHNPIGIECGEEKYLKQQPGGTMAAVNSTSLANENKLPDKTIAVIQKWQSTLQDNRKVANKIIDALLNQRIGLSSADLPDTSTFAGGLDSIEEALDQNDYDGAFSIAKDTVVDMLADEGFGMDEGQHGRYAQEAGAVYNDGFDPFRKEIGVKKVNEFLAKFGLGPNYKPSKPKLHECPRCKKCQVRYTEMHADTDMNEMVLECPDCGNINEGQDVSATVQLNLHADVQSNTSGDERLDVLINKSKLPEREKQMLRLSNKGYTENDIGTYFNISGNRVSVILQRAISRLRQLGAVTESSQIKTFQQIKDEHDPNGQHHDLTLTCVKCGNTHSCRCSKPKRKFNGICDRCSSVN